MHSLQAVVIQKHGDKHDVLIEKTSEASILFLLMYEFLCYSFTTIIVIVTELNCLCSHAACYYNCLVVIIQNKGKKAPNGLLLAIKILFSWRKIMLNMYIICSNSKLCSTASSVFVLCTVYRLWSYKNIQINIVF